MKNEDEKTPNSDMDGGWKDIIEDFTEEFFSFYLPEIHREIDFRQEIRFLDRELNEIVSDSENIKREADRLLEVYLKNGRAEWILIHIEVQSYRDRTFAERMYVYNYRIFDKYRRNPVSIAVLTDGERGFRPDNFRLEQFGCVTDFRFPVIKLLDLDSEELVREENPFAVVTRVQLAKLRSERNPDQRYSFRMELTEELYDRPYSKEQVIRLYRFIDYILTLPKPKALQFRKELEHFEEGRKMPYMTSTACRRIFFNFLKSVQEFTFS
ncbi:MAG: cytosolic protein [Candidatus Electrothrix sp. EH2]|nr:cytosolic protein [Candidatus Electrothrix sp. EH2]